jgi:ATP synthase in type III secretion protein N
MGRKRTPVSSVTFPAQLGGASDMTADKPIDALLSRWQHALDTTPPELARSGRIAGACGMLLKVTGLPLHIGQACWLRSPRLAEDMPAEVVGLDAGHALLMPAGGTQGIGLDTTVHAGASGHDVAVGPELLGRVFDGNGAPLDQRPAPACRARVPLRRAAPEPMTRPLIETALATGVRAIDSLLACGVGQRVGIFAAAGAGKSSLLGMLARGATADVIVVALVGERGREVREFIADNLGAVGFARSVVVAATSDRPALERARAVDRACAIAEHFRDQGQRVLLLVDSVTRLARALRDIGLAAGELPARAGYPPSVFSVLPQIFERAGAAERGSISAFYTVLVEDDDSTDPIAEEVRSLLDGHIVLSRQLANGAHFPAIDVLASVSRVMPRVVDADHAQAALTARRLLAKQREVELLVQLGEYRAGTDAVADAALACHGPLTAHLRQRADTLEAFAPSLASLRRALAVPAKAGSPAAASAARR